MKQWGSGRPDRDIQQRRDEILRGLSAREAPRVLLLFSAIIILFDAGYAIIGIIPPLGYYVSDAIQGGFNVIVALLIMRRVIPVRWAPAAFALAICVDNLMLNYQYTVVGYSAVGVILLTMTVYGAITMVWRPFLISAAWMAGLTSYTLITNDPENGMGWALTALTALTVSGVVLYGRSVAVIALAKANRTIEELAIRDALTGLLNRHGLENSAPLLASTARRNGQPLFAMFIDVCGLKAVNDSHGHPAGDLVIRRTADSVQRLCRDSDLVCRWGGDEFVMVGAGQAPEAYDFTRRVIADIDMSGLTGKWVADVSIGVASSSEQSVEALIREADLTMYEIRRDLRTAHAP